MVQGPPGTDAMLSVFLKRSAERGARSDLIVSNVTASLAVGVLWSARGGVSATQFQHGPSPPQQLLGLAGDGVLEALATASGSKLEELQQKLR